VIFDVPTEAANRLDIDGNLMLVNSNDDFDFLSSGDQIGVFRTYQ